MSNPAQKALCLARVTSELLKRTQQAEEKQAAEKSAIASLIPDVVEALVKHERIMPYQKEAVAKGLTDHKQCLEALMKLAANRNASEIQSIGTPVEGAQTKQASALTGMPVSDFDAVESGQRFTEILMRGK